MKSMVRVAARTMIALAVLLSTASSLSVEGADPVVTFTSLTSSLNPSVYGDTVTFTAVVSASGGAPAGKVGFYEVVVETFDTSQILLGEDATATTLGEDSYGYTFSTSTLAVGQHAIFAAYDDGSGISPASSAPVLQTVEQQIWPTISITSAPPETSYSTEATFEFSSDPEGAEFECALSEGAVSNYENMTWAACSSPKLYTGLSYGAAYTFAVRIQGAPLIAWTAAGHLWYIAWPQITITSGPAEVTESTEATFTFSSNPAGIDLECYLAKGEYGTQNVVVVQDWAPCSSPRTFAGLPRGYAYSFAVRLEGAADYYPVTWQWMLTNLTLTASPNPSQSGSNVTFTATVWDDSGTVPGGTVTFAELISPWPGVVTPQPLGQDASPTAAAPGSYAYTFSTAELAVGSHEIIAMYQDDGGTFTSLPTVQIVTEVTALAPVITTQPAHQTVCAGNSVSLAAAASGTPAPTVQWQVSNDGGTTWNTISGATTTTYAFTAAAGDNGKRYRAVFTNSAGSAASSAAILTVNTAPLVTTQPANRTVTYGAPNATFSAAASGTAPSVQWQRSTNGTTWTNMAGATTTNLTIANPTVPMSDTRYRAVFSNLCGTATSSAATLTVNKKAASVTADDKSKTYGDNNPELTAIVVGAVADGDPINYTLSTTAERYSGVGDYPIVVTLGSNPNYSVTKADGTLTVAKKEASVTADDRSKAYGDDNPTLTATVVGTVAGSDPINYTLSTTAETLSNVGDYPIEVTLGANPNYNVTKADGKLTIARKDASVTADDKSKTYGDDNPELTATVVGELAGGDPVNYSLSTTAKMLSNAGDYPIVVSLGANPNYEVTPTDGTLTINKRDASVTPDSFTRQYSDGNPELTGTLSGFLESDGITADFDTPATWESVPGSYDITATLSPQERLGNYNITYDVRTLTVVKEDATVSLAPDNSLSVEVAEPEGNSGQFVLTADVKEKAPDLPGQTAAAGDISLAGIEVTLVPVGPGSPVTAVCEQVDGVGTGYDAVKEVACTFNDVPVNTYSIEVTVVGDYYTGGPAEGVVVVFDPSLGFTTGGGWFTWPETDERTNFGYTMKYNKKGTSVQGSLLLIRHLADGTIYRMKSNALYGLAIVDDTASFSGKSTYQEPTWDEPVGNYDFAVYVEDNGDPNVGLDRFWIKVLDGMTMGGTGSKNAVMLQGGNIVVPHADGKRK